MSAKFKKVDFLVIGLLVAIILTLIASVAVGNDSNYRIRTDTVTIPVFPESERNILGPRDRIIFGNIFKKDRKIIWVFPSGTKVTETFSKYIKRTGLRRIGYYNFPVSQIKARISPRPRTYSRPPLRSMPAMRYIRPSYGGGCGPGGCG